MAEQEESTSGEDRTEDATPERREEFRDRGQVVVSRDLTSVLVLVGCLVFFSLSLASLTATLTDTLRNFLSTAGQRNVSGTTFPAILWEGWRALLYAALPICCVAAAVATVATLAQSRFNFAWPRLEPDWSRLNPISGIGRMFSMQAVVDLGKGIAKMAAVSLVAFLVLKSQWHFVPGLMNLPINHTWRYWAEITNSLAWGVAILAALIAGSDYLYSFFTIERRMRMTKQELKEEIKKREVDPHLKARQRRAQRDITARRTIANTRKATVVITNPTHYAVALRYSVGMGAPICVAKGIDHLALQMREVAREAEVPIVEDRPLARALYDVVSEGEEIPENLYRAVSEIIRFVFRLKGIKLGRSRQPDAPA